MRNLFQAFYKPTEEEFKVLWNDALIVLDTNALLNMYRYSEKTYQSYLKLLTEYKDRLWMPYTVGREFHTNRYKSKHSQHKFYSEIVKILESFIAPFEKVLGNCRYHRFIDHDVLLKEFKKRIESQIKSVEKTEKKHKQILDSDSILSEITNLYEGKVGAPLEKDTYKEKCANGKKRYDNKVPPGYEDKDPKRGNSQYGDYLIWNAMIDKASETKQDIIFVTDDGKEDWWLLDHGKTIGPRPELREEFKLESGQNIYFYKPTQFLIHACNDKRIDIPKAVTNEISTVSDAHTENFYSEKAHHKEDTKAETNNKNNRFKDMESYLSEISDTSKSINTDDMPILAKNDDGTKPSPGSLGAFLGLALLAILSAGSKDT